MAKFGRTFWNNNDFINVFDNFQNLYYQVYNDLCKFRHILLNDI